MKRVGEDEHDALHHRVVAREDRVDQEQPHSRPPEDRLGQDGAAEQRAELEPDHGQDGHERVPEGVARHDQALAEALGAGGADVLLAQNLQHGRAGHAGDERDREGGQRERGEDQAHAPLGAGRGQPVQVDGEDDDQHEAEPVGRHGDAEQRRQGEHVVEAGVGPRGGEGAGGHPGRRLARAALTTARVRVARSRGLSSSSTGWDVRAERPRFPWSSRSRKTPYWTWSGWSRPRSTRSRATSSSRRQEAREHLRRVARQERGPSGRR